jgi:hypothetical protein
MKRGLFSIVLLCAVLSIAASDDDCGTAQRNDTDAQQRRQQETILAEGSAQTGMPAIKNFRERKLLKDILELRDQDGLVTYTYTFAEMTGTLKFFCNSIGYGIPYATEYTNPQKTVSDYHDSATIAQADPNGLYSPASAEGTWVMCLNPATKRSQPVYLEPRVIVSPFKLETP